METRFKDLLGELGEYQSSEYKSNFEIQYYSNGSVCKSYNKVIGIYIKDKGYYFTKWHDFSSTTNKHCICWCNLSVEDRRYIIKASPSHYILDYD